LGLNALLDDVRTADAQLLLSTAPSVGTAWRLRVPR
jgi:hypothetical protein